MSGYGTGLYGLGPYGIGVSSPVGTRINVGVWEQFSGATWAKVRDIRTWTAVSVEPRFLEPGLWSLAMPYDAQAASLSKGQLLTFDLERDGETYRLLTGSPTAIGPAASETGNVTLEASGVGALGLLGNVLNWPAPASALGSQGVSHYTATGAAETVLRALIMANWVTRLGLDLTIPASTGRGSTVRLNERFSNLLAVVAAKCEVGGLGVRMGLVETTSATRAELQLEFFVPSDVSQRVRLSNKVGSLRTWKQADNAPTVTRAIVAGGGVGTSRLFRQLSDPVQEAAWGGWPIETWVDQRQTTDTGEMDEAGQEALDAGASQSAFELEAVEAEGIRFGQHFDLGDTVAIELMTGLATTDVLRAVQVESGDGGTTIKLVPGLPDAAQPLFQQAAIIRQLRRDIRALQREEG